MTSVSNESAPAVLSGEVAAPQKFESLFLHRKFTRLEGESKAHFIADVALPFILFAPLLIVELGRYIGFKIGSKNAKVAKYFDGKSFSILDKMSAAVKSLAEKAMKAWSEVKGKIVAKFKELTTKKPVTLLDLNAKSEKAMKGHVGALVQAYQSHNESAVVTTKPEEKIAKAQRALAKEILNFVENNAEGSQEFAAVLEGAKKQVREMIEKGTEDQFYVDSKMVRRGPLVGLTPVVLAEFDHSLTAPSFQKKTAALFLRKAEGESNYVQALAKGLETKILTAEQADSALKTRATSSYSQNLNLGLVTAESGLKDLLTSATQARVVEANRAQEINSSIKMDVADLARAAANDVLKSGSEENEESVLAQLTAKASLLKESGRLKAEEETHFLSLARSFINIELDRRSAAKMDAARAEEEAKAQEAAAIEKAAARELITAQLGDFLNVASTTQSTLSDRFSAYDALNKEVGAIQAQYGALQEQKVSLKIDGKMKSMKLLDAHTLYHKELRKLATLSDAQVEKRLQDLTNNDDATIGYIKQLGDMAQQLQAKLADRRVLSREIDSLFNQSLRELAVFDGRFNRVKGELEVQNRKALSIRREAAEEIQAKLIKKHKRVFHPGSLVLTKPLVQVSRDADQNAADFAAILNAGQEPGALLASAPAEEQTA
jgi:hypothetical protein